MISNYNDNKLYKRHEDDIKLPALAIYMPAITHLMNLLTQNIGRTEKV